MKKIFPIIFCLFLLPLTASAHAVPVQQSPENDAVLSIAPVEVSIRFSERLDVAASAISVLGPAGSVSLSAAIRGADAKTLVVPIKDAGTGAYTVKWSVVSSDDGHFTRGTYAFSVGEAAAVGGSDMEIVQLTTTSEAIAMTVELLGNGIIWAALILFIFAIRPIIVGGVSEAEGLRRAYARYLLLGATLAFTGGLIQVIVKTLDLAAVREIPFVQALPLYVSTMAGSMTLLRMFAILVVSAIFIFARKIIIAAKQVTAGEIAMLLCMSAFALARAVVSHATANPFFPELSIAMNFIHLIEKDIWAGTALALLLCILSKKLRGSLNELIPYASRLLTLDLAAVSVTATYIVWLHLKSFSNLFTTEWGSAFLNLLTFAVLLVVLRTYHVLAPRVLSRIYEKFLPVSLGLEAALSLVVLYSSSVVIITSPPLHEGARTLDAFTWWMIGIAALSLCYALVLYAISGVRTPLSLLRGADGRAIGIFLLMLFVGGNAIAYADASALWNPYKARCLDDGNMWHLMLPTRAGVPVSDTPREGCMWGMGEYVYQFPDPSEYEKYSMLPHAEVLMSGPESIRAGFPTNMTFELREPDGTPATLFVDMEKLVHIVIASADQKYFAHIHADDALSDPENSRFLVRHVFPMGGRYLISVDYAHGLTLETKQFFVDVTGSPAQSAETAVYPAVGDFSGYQVQLKYSQPFAQEPVTLRYSVSKDGKPMTNLMPYLSAAMHVSAIKNDLSEFVHTHGEIHPPGVPYPPLRVKNGKIVHSMLSMTPPAQFGPEVEAHIIFPSSGLYTVWGEFRVDDKVIPTSFTVRAEE